MPKKKARVHTYHLVGGGNKTLCGKQIEGAGGRRPQVMLTTSLELKRGRVCKTCSNLKQGGKTPVTEKKVREKKGLPEGKIHLLTDKNPRRKGTKAHAQFALYKNGMTPKEFIAAGGRLSDLAWDLKRRHVEIR
jgi:hypothetical protein